MFYENNDNWSNGQHNGFESFVGGIIGILLISIIIMIFYTPSKTLARHKAKPNVPIENKNIQEKKETNNSINVNADNNYKPDNTVVDIKEQERQVKKELKLHEINERQQKLKLQKQKTKLEQKEEKQRLKNEKRQQKMEKQRLKEEKRKQKSERKNKNNTENELPNINDSIEDIPSETE